MPLTFAHPAAVLPFKYLPKKWYSWTGLIIGSMVPDFEAFIKMGGSKVFSHTWAGMFLYDLPVGVLLVLLFHFIVRDALIDQLPGFLFRRFYVLKGKARIGAVNRYFVVIVSLLVGIATHLIWDRITHTDTYTYTERVGISFEPEIDKKLRQWLQWGCSAAGLLLLLWQILVLPVVTNVKRKPWRNFWWLAVGVALTIFAVRLNFFYVFNDDLINTAIAGFLWGIIVASAAVKLRRPVRH